MQLLQRFSPSILPTLQTHLNLPEYIPPKDHNPVISDPVLRAIEIYKVHPSIRNIKELTNKLRDKPFEFNHVLPWEICKEVHNLKSKNSSIEISVKILKETINNCLPHLTDILTLFSMGGGGLMPPL